MQNFSTTQAANLAIFAGAIFLVVKHFKPEIAITKEDIEVILTATFVFVAAVVSFVNRFKKGDLTLGGFRK